MKAIAIIPARMAATRFPGKPLKPILGLPMIGHIYKRSSFSKEFEEIYVATCDQEIFDYTQSIGGKAVMTSPTHPNCIDRASEALINIEKLLKKKFDVIAMVQGDEPLVTPDVYTLALEVLRDNKDLQVVNIMGKIESLEEFNSPNVVKVVTDQELNALYMSREPIPSLKKGNQENWLKQTGLIFFRRDYLLKFNNMKRTPLELCEGIDMLRVLEHGEKVKMIYTDTPCLSIDTPKDLEVVEKLMANDSLFKSYNKQEISL